MTIKRVGILTGGGDCPGLNAAIRAVVRRLDKDGVKALGILGGWKGLMNMAAMELTLNSVSGILVKGGTIIGTSRTNPFKDKDGPEIVKRNFGNFNLDGLIAIGGEDTLGVAAKLFKEGMPIVGVPKTIDNDLWGTDITIGFDTAVTIATEAIDRLHTTAESHNRVIIVEVMGRHAGWIAVEAGLAGGADAILIPEVPFKVSDVANLILRRHNRGKNFSIIVVSEGAKIQTETGEPMEILRDTELDEFGHVQLGGIGEMLRVKLKEATGFTARVTILGYIQRGGEPTAFDRILATRLGVKGAEMVLSGKFGNMAAICDNKITSTPLSELLGKVRTVDLDLYKIAEVFFG